MRPSLVAIFVPSTLHSGNSALVLSKDLPEDGNGAFFANPLLVPLELVAGTPFRPKLLSWLLAGALGRVLEVPLTP